MKQNGDSSNNQSFELRELGSVCFVLGLHHNFGWKAYFRFASKFERMNKQMKVVMLMDSCKELK